MDISKETFDEYRTRRIGITQPESAGDMGDDEASIIYESIEGDAPYDFTEGENESEGEGLGMGNRRLPAALSPEDRQFLVHMNESTFGLPGVHQFSIPEETPQPQPQPRPQRQLGPAFEYNYPQTHENMEAVAEESDQEGQGITLCFSSSVEANRWGRKNNQTAIDTTIPQTTREKKNVVRALLSAMMSVEFAEDNEGMVKPFRDGRYSKERMEVECWNVLGWCIQRHSHGPLLATYDHIKVKQTSRIDDFKTRMEHIVDVLRRHKTICKHLLDAPYILSFVDDPVGCKNRVVANKALNKRKGEVMTAGKEALGETPTTGARGRPRKRDSPGSTGVVKREDPTSSIGPASRTRKNPRETPRTRADSDIPVGYVPAGLSTLTMESPTPASHSAQRAQRRRAQAHSLDDDGHSNNVPANPYDPNTVTSGTQDPREPLLNPNPGPGARKPRKTAPQPTTPARGRSTRGRAKNTASGRGRKRSERDSDDQDYAPTPQKKSNR